jgi:hypothetical protein
MLQGERIQEAKRILAQVWEEMQRGYVDDTTTFLQTAVYCQVNIDRIVFMGNKYLEADVRKDGGATIFNKECAYREEPPHRYVNVIDNACKMLRCPECKCQIQAYPFSYAVGTRGYSFCPYCGKDMRKHETEKTTS